MLAIELGDILDASVALLVLFLSLYVGYRWLRVIASDMRVIRESIARIEGRLEGMTEPKLRRKTGPKDPLDVDLPPKKP